MFLFTANYLKIKLLESLESLEDSHRQTLTYFFALGCAYPNVARGNTAKVDFFLLVCSDTKQWYISQLSVFFQSTAIKNGTSWDKQLLKWQT